MSGSGSSAIEISSLGTGDALIVAGNSIHNCTEDINDTAMTTKQWGIEEASSVEADDPLVNAAGGDYSVEVDSLSYRSAYSGFAQQNNRGADMKENASGGSPTAVTTSYAFVG